MDLQADGAERRGRVDPAPDVHGVAGGGERGLYEPAKMRLYGPAKKFALEKTSVDESAGAMLWEESEKAVGAFEV